MLTPAQFTLRGRPPQNMRVELGGPSIQKKKRQLSVWFNRPPEITWSEMSCTQRLHQRMHDLCMCACVRDLTFFCRFELVRDRVGGIVYAVSCYDSK